MCESKMNTDYEGLRVWGHDGIDYNTILQAQRTARLPIMAGPVGLMPDAHVGMGATVGSVVATRSAIIPSCVGVDLGCGMEAIKTNLTSADLPDSLKPLLYRIEKLIPAGVGEAHNHSSTDAERWLRKNPIPGELKNDRRNKIENNALKQFGTLGSGNHFVEISLDEDDTVWAVLHSGSRGPGNMLAQQHISAAKKLAEQDGLKLEDKDLAWLSADTPEFDAYVEHLLWAQRYAFGNREAMMNALIKAMREKIAPGMKVLERISCHHNYTEQETHLIDGKPETVWLTRKGAINASSGFMGVIPGSMGTDTYVIQGLGNADSYNSCSHGAGRKMSRSKAKKLLTTEDLRAQMANRTWLSGSAEALLDESPDAYKDIASVMEAQSDLVEVVAKLDAILNFKGAK